MTFAEDMGYDCYDLDDLKGQDTLIDSVKVIENGYVVEKDYCTKCKSINIKVSKKGNNIFIKDILDLMFKEIKYTDLQVSYMMQWYFELKQRHLIY